MKNELNITVKIENIIIERGHVCADVLAKEDSYEPQFIGPNKDGFVFLGEIYKDVTLCTDDVKRDLLNAAHELVKQRRSFVSVLGKTFEYEA